MATKKATIKAEWDEGLEKKIEKKMSTWDKSCGAMSKSSSAGGGAVYGMGLIGALFYYLGQGGDFGTILLAVLKAIVWPAMAVYHLFNFLNL